VFALTAIICLQMIAGVVCVCHLQPAVESFFLVHATAAEEHRLAAYDGRDGRSVHEQRTRENPAPPEVAIIQPDVAPVSDSDGNSTTQPSPIYLNFNWEVTPSPVTLPPDQQKFLKFAGLFSYENNLRSFPCLPCIYMSLHMKGNLCRCNTETNFSIRFI
jgi:hypothetical protein